MHRLAGILDIADSRHPVLELPGILGSAVQEPLVSAGILEPIQERQDIQVLVDSLVSPAHQGSQENLATAVFQGSVVNLGILVTQDSAETVKSSRTLRTLITSSFFQMLVNKSITIQVPNTFTLFHPTPRSRIQSGLLLLS